MNEFLRLARAANVPWQQPVIPQTAGDEAHLRALLDRRGGGDHGAPDRGFVLMKVQGASAQVVNRPGSVETSFLEG